MKEDKYLWTHHAREKMKYYRLTEARVKRIIRHPTRLEEGVLDEAVACMQPAHGNGRGSPSLTGRPAKNYSEIWVMYLLAKPSAKGQKSKIKIITAWRYPGKSPSREPVPANILKEARKLIYG